MSFSDRLSKFSSFFGFNDDNDDFEEETRSSAARLRKSDFSTQERNADTSHLRRKAAATDNVVEINRQKEPARQVTRQVKKTESVVPSRDRIKTSPNKSREDYLSTKEERKTSANAPILKQEHFTTEVKNNARPKITIKQPRIYADAMKIADFAMNDEAILVNFHYMEEYQARRVIDFLTGIAHALHGDLQRVGNQIFLLTPPSIQIDGNEAKSLVNNHNFDYEI
ncbi:MAG: cell division protein SepF [Streptococcaceae bacterium]|jgi:cell division inhibitor SepF|nr:cell division protein SepF [Streptococcaceae bacterium]